MHKYLLHGTACVCVCAHAPRWTKKKNSGYIGRRSMNACSLSSLFSIDSPFISSRVDTISSCSHKLLAFFGWLFFVAAGKEIHATELAST